MAPADFHTPDVVFRIGMAPQRIDILTSISGVTFDEAWPDRISIRVDGVLVPVIGIRQLFANKAATGRQKDQNDLTILRDRLG